MSALQNILTRKVEAIVEQLAERYRGLDDVIKTEVVNTTVSIMCESATRAASLMKEMQDLGMLEVQCFYNRRRKLPYRCVGRIY
jgi:hypothetical protein